MPSIPSRCKSEINNASYIMHRGTFLKPLRRIPGRSENFLRDGAQYRVAHRGKGPFCFLTASFNAISKNAGIGDRSGDLVVRSRDKSPYSKYSIFVLELVPLPPELSSSHTNILYLQYSWSRTSHWANYRTIQNFKNARIGDRSGYRAFRSREMSVL